MSHRKTLRLCILLASFWVSSFAQAQDDKVTAWVQNTLLATLSVSYEDNQPLFDKIKLNYTYDAWNSLKEFLGNYMTVIKNQKLTLHPALNGPATLIESGTVKDSHFFSGIRFWKVNQSIHIPELKLGIDFSVLVIATSSGNYLMASLDMLIHEI